MRKLTRALIAAILLTLALCITASAADYTYTVRFYSGGQGTFSGREWVVFENLNYGDRVTFNRNSVQLEDSSKYYIKGIRESGKDNNTVGLTSFIVTCDQDYVVAYGILGNAVQYTVRYVDRYGNQLAPDDVYYGNVGDKPVVAYRYIEGYQPQYYNITGTLHENASDNVFTFVYVPIRTGAGITIVGPNGETTTTVIDNTEGDNNPGTVVSGGNNNNNNNNNDNNDNNNDGPQEIIDIDPPQSGPGNGNGEKVDDNDSPFTRFINALKDWIAESPVRAGASAAAVVAMLIWLWWLLLLLRRKKKDEAQDETDKH